MYIYLHTYSMRLLINAVIMLDMKYQFLRGYKFKTSIYIYIYIYKLNGF